MNKSSDQLEKNAYLLPLPPRSTYLTVQHTLAQKKKPNEETKKQSRKENVVVFNT